MEFKVSRRAVTIVPTATERDDITLTPQEAKRLRQSLKQMRQGKLKAWAQVKDELGL